MNAGDAVALMFSQVTHDRAGAFVGSPISHFE